MSKATTPNKGFTVSLKIDKSTTIFELPYLVHDTVYTSPLQVKYKACEGAMNVCLLGTNGMAANSLRVQDEEVVGAPTLVL
jgi:hypothetical protein